MKKIYKSISLLFMAFAIMGIFSSCNTEDESMAGVPKVSYVRITNPAASDSLLAAAGQGQLIAIIGENLQNARKIWFNDQPSTLTPTYVTNKSILVNVPSKLPLTISNKLKIIFQNGDSLFYDFKVAVNKPTIGRMDCEYVLDGEVATIHGDYFYLPLTVTFPGGVNGTDVTVDEKNQILKVKVPAGAKPGQITVTSNFGVTKSNFWFRDNRNVIADADPITGWSGSGYLVTNPGLTDPPAISNNYWRVKQTIGVWAWTELINGSVTTAIPDDAILKPTLFNLKFEVCTTKPYNNNGMRFSIGKGDNDSGDYNWNPPIDTKGVWQTIIIPFEDIMSVYSTPNVLIPSGYKTRIVFLGGTELNCDMSFDNFRVVPKTVKP
jgi:hypothetical protein